MPVAPRPPCRTLRCPRLALPGRAMCETHAGASKAERDASRPGRQARGYGAAHQRLRREVLAEEPSCALCGTEFLEGDVREMDHADGDVTNTERSNLRAVHRACHSRKTVAEQSRWGRGARILPPQGTGTGALVVRRRSRNSERKAQ